MVRKDHASSGSGSSRKSIQHRILAGSLALGMGVFLLPYIAHADTSSQNVSRTSKVGDSGSAASWRSHLWGNYYGIYYGSSVGSPSRYQSGPYTKKDLSRPIFVKNFLTVGYDLSDRFAVAATGYFTYTPGDPDTQLELRDPSVRFADNSILSVGGFNWYGDVRAHFPITTPSRIDDMLAAFQTFHYFSYQPTDSDWNFGLYASLRYNIFGKLGVGNDLELYFAPAANYSLGQHFALTFLYELGANHGFGENPGTLDNSGTDFEPGVLWQVTPNLELNPYLNFYTGGKINLDTTSFGMTLSWMML